MKEHVILLIRKILDEGRDAEIRLYGKKKRELEKRCEVSLSKLRKKFRIKTKHGPRVD